MNYCFRNVNLFIHVTHLITASKTNIVIHI
jgi:hypothetical protein